MKATVEVILLPDLLQYDPASGQLEWKIRPRHYFKSERDWRAWNTLYVFWLCFICKMANGYLAGRIFDQNFLAHRVIWALVYGHWPRGLIDHINRVKDDNRIENLREAIYLENGRNRPSSKNSSSKYLGVSWDARRGHWRSVIQIDGKHCEIGRYGDEVEAAKAYDARAARHHGQFAFLNFGPEAQ